MNTRQTIAAVAALCIGGFSLPALAGDDFRRNRPLHAERAPAVHRDHNYHYKPPRVIVHEARANRRHGYGHRYDQRHGYGHGPVHRHHPRVHHHGHYRAHRHHHGGVIIHGHGNGAGAAPLFGAVLGAVIAGELADGDPGARVVGAVAGAVIASEATRDRHSDTKIIHRRR